MGVAFDQLFHLPQVGLLDALKLLISQTNTVTKKTQQQQTCLLREPKNQTRH